MDEEAVARLSRLLAIAELVNHSDGWLRRSSKNAKFQMVADDFPDLVDDPPLEAAIDRFDERVVAAAANRWHPSLVDPTSNATEPLLLQVSMLRDGVGATPMWRGRIIDSPRLFTGEGRFVLQFSSLTDQSNAEQMRGALDSMQQPETVAALVVFAQALMWHAAWTAESFGISVPRVGYVLMMEAHLKERVEDILRLTDEHAWPAMEGHIPADADAVLKIVEEMTQGGEMSSPGPIIRRWTDNTMMIDGHALTIELMHRLRMDPRTGGERVNVSATDFELSVQALIDQAGASPEQATRALRGTTLRVSGSSITDIDALMQAGPNLICISCKKFELGRPYDVGDYGSVRNAKTNVEAAVVEWAERMEEIDTRRVGDNFDLSQFEKLIGLVVTPELAFVDSPDALEMVTLTDGVAVPRYLSFGELASAIETLTSS